MRDHDTLAPRPAPTHARPMLGLTVLAVEDSRFASEALRLLCLRSGARIRRADSLRSARRHLRIYRPSVVIIDVGLPDGSGIDLVAELARAEPRIGVILATSGDAGRGQAARAAGADGFLEKPLDSLARFHQEMLCHLPRQAAPAFPRPVAEEPIVPDPIAYRDDLEHMRELLRGRPDAAMLAYAAQFLSGVAHAAGDPALATAAEGLAGHGAQAGVAHVSGLIEQRLAERMTI